MVGTLYSSRRLRPGWSLAPDVAPPRHVATRRVIKLREGRWRRGRDRPILTGATSHGRVNRYMGAHAGPLASTPEPANRDDCLRLHGGGVTRERGRVPPISRGFRQGC